MDMHWSKLTHLFPEEENCLASFIAWKAAEVIAGAKPANLINIPNRKLSCGRNMYKLWGKYKVSDLTEEKIWSLELQDNGNRKLDLIYNPAELEKCLKKVPIKKALTSLKYNYNNVDEALKHLKKRMKGADFPHEIGFFLGYPAKDVYGFMRLCDLPVANKVPWKMYGKLESSIAVLNKHREAKQLIVEALCSGENPLSMIKNAA